MTGENTMTVSCGSRWSTSTVPMPPDWCGIDTRTACRRTMCSRSCSLSPTRSTALADRRRPTLPSGLLPTPPRNNSPARFSTVEQTSIHLPALRLTGTPPFTDSNPTVVIGNHLSSPPPRLASLRPDLGAVDDVLAKAMAKEPFQRFSSCREFASALSHRVDFVSATAGGYTILQSKQSARWRLLVR